MAEFSMDQFEQDYRNERRKALRDSVKSGKTSLPVGILQHGANRISEGVSDTVQGIGAFAKSLYSNPQSAAESGAEGLESLYNRVAQGDPMAAMEVAGMVATGGATAAVAKGARLADFATFDPDTSRMFIGDVGAENLEKAGRPVAKKVLQVARQMRMRGASEAEIRAKTNQIIEKEDPSLGGVSSNAAGQLVVEIDDSKMALRSDSAIRRATGGYQNPEGGMYFPADVDNVLKGTVFPKAYPNEASIRIADVSEADQQLGLSGEFEPSTNTLTTYVLNNEVPNVASHELQHYIQFKENFPKGANLDDAALGLYGPIADDYDEIASILINFANEKIPEDVFDAYDNPEIMKKSVAEMLEESGGDKLYAAEFAEAEAEAIRNNPSFYLTQLYKAVSGEVEARNVQTRLKMTAAERRATPPEDTEDIPRSQQTIIRRVQGGEVMQGVGSLNETARNMFRGPRGIGAYQQLASGGEAMGPPPTRGPDPQGIGAYQQFADGGPVYMSNGGDPFAGVDFEALTEAVIQTESGGDPNAVSVDDAIGLMQILPSTAAQPGYENYGAENVFDIAIDMGFPVDEGERTVEKARQLLFDPEVNMAFGKKYLQAMISHSDGDIKAALQKYNAGTGNYQAFIEGRKPLDQEAVKYPITVAKFLRSLMSPEAQEERALRRRAYEEDYTTPEPAQSGIAELLPSFKRAERDMTVMASDQSVGEQLRQDFQPYFGSESQQDDFELLPPTPAPAIQQPSGLMEKYSAPNMAERLLGKKPRIKPKLRPPEVEFGEDKGGVFRSLMPPRRKQKEYPRNDPDALFRGLGKIRGRTLRKGFTPYVQDVRGELT